MAYGALGQRERARAILQEVRLGLEGSYAARVAVGLHVESTACGWAQWGTKTINHALLEQIAGRPRCPLHGLPCAHAIAQLLL